MIALLLKPHIDRKDDCLMIKLKTRSHISWEMKIKTNFFLPLIDCAIDFLKDRFVKTHNVAEIFSFLLNLQNLLKKSGLNWYNACQ